MSTIATNDENVSFRIQDQNRSTFWVESRPKDYRVGVEVLGQGVNYFYFTPEQYKIFIHSEFNRLFKVSKRQLSAKEMHNGNSEQVDNTSERTGNRLSDNTPGTEATTTRTKT